MRRLARHLFTLCSAVSLLLAVSVGYLWWRGCTVGDTVLLRHAGSGGRPAHRVYVAQLWSSGGGLRVLLGWYGRDGTPPVAVRRLDHGSYNPGSLPYPYERFGKPRDVAWGGFGFELFRREYGVVSYREHFGSVTLPCWAVLLLTLAMPLRGARRVVRARRARWRVAARLCPSCAYDLRATPDRCPECGTAAAIRVVKL